MFKTSLSRLSIFIIAFLSLCALSNCSIKLTPFKSPEAFNAITDIRESVNGLYDNIRNADDKSYPAFEVDYQAISDKISTLTLTDKTRSKAGNLVTQDEDISKLFTTYRQEHIAKGKLSIYDIRVYKSFMKSIIDPRLISELRLK